MKILLFGDSNTFGTAPMPHLGADGVVAKRWGDVLADELHEHEVAIDGVPGRTTVHDDPIEGPGRNGLGALPAVLAAHKPNELLIICLGTNDLKARFSVGPMDIALSLRRLMKEARATGWVDDIMLLCPPPALERGDLAEIFAGAEVKATSLAPQIERIAREDGAGFFDAGTIIASDPLDGIHWSAESHVALGRAVAAELRPLG